MRKAWPIYTNGIATHFARDLSVEETQVITHRMTRILDALE